MEYAIYDGKTVDGEDGVRIRAELKLKGAKPRFTCVECGDPAGVYKAGKSGKPPAHFEHHRRNDYCSLVR